MTKKKRKKNAKIEKIDKDVLLMYQELRKQFFEFHNEQLKT
jgi:hypothetical protein